MDFAFHKGRMMKEYLVLILWLCLWMPWQCHASQHWDVAAQDVHDAWLTVPGVGHLQGVQYPSLGVRIFAGIPYAEAPVGDLRWRAPKPLPRSENLLDARAFGPACPQESYGKVIGDEDCLTLNVFVPTYKDGKNSSLPVMIWIHGGGYTKGTANVGLNGTWGPLYSGAALAGEGAVVVTVQYRLGALGFLGSSQLRSREKSMSSGNYGIQDQRLALQWVRQHAAQFGGDQQRIFIFGQSAGAGAVNWHLVAPASRDLFHAAALQSGACAPWASQTWQGAEATSDAFLRVTECADVGCLLGKSASELAAATKQVEALGFGWAPTVDGVELDDLPCNKMERGEFARVPVIVGFTRDEAGPGGTTELAEADFDDLLRIRVPQSLRAQVKAEYTARYSEWYWAAKHFEADIDFSCPARRFARAAATFGAVVFAYKFSRQPSFPPELMMGPHIAPQQFWGAYHGAELPFVFGSPRIDVWNITLTEHERQLAVAVMKQWVAVARTGNASSDWTPLLDGGSRPNKWLLLDAANVSVNEVHLLSQCDTLDEVGRLTSHAFVV